MYWRHFFLYSDNPVGVMKMYLFGWACATIGLLFDEWHFILLALYFLISGFLSDPQHDVPISDLDRESESV